MRIFFAIPTVKSGIFLWVFLVDDAKHLQDETLKWVNERLFIKHTKKDK